ncbi:hypothetical protein [Chromohalobacter israelensis]|uniref:hypothetical protein n=1 Tax=Chromohalobacter israelensis TaxID=141390 RepID=UPI00265C5120|nr:hypothetical protein [Chromohalobacter salexigens]MDO0944662.1 hypothetical protein [Chromohalobacter salexigens]
MSLSEAQFQRWLESPNEHRVVLIELDHAAGTEQVADQPYLAPANEQLADPVYRDVLASAVGISTRIDGLVEFGDVTLIDDGAITHWLDYQWRGYPVRVFLGDMAWPRAEFRQVATATNDGIARYRQGQLVMSVVDASAQLDTPIDTGQLPDAAGPIPLVLGQCYNVPAYRDDTTTLHHRVSYLPLVSATPRDIGNPVPHTADLSGGGFTLDNAPGNASEITAAAHEQHDTPLALVQWVADRYGLSVSPETTLPDVTVGFQSSSQVSGAQILEALRDTLGAGWMLDPLGRLDVRVITAPGDTPDVTLAPDDVQDGTLHLEAVEPPWSALTLRWGRNHAPLRTVAASVSDSDTAQAERLKRAWSESTVEQTLTGFPLAHPETRDTLLQVAGEVTAERDRRLAYHATRLERWRVTTYRPTVAVYQSITINLPPIAGRVGRVTAVRLARVGGKAELEILI